jgi:hypothetical protein
MLAGLAAIAYVRFGTSIAWTWYVMIGSSVTFGGGVAASVWRERVLERGVKA